MGSIAHRVWIIGAVLWIASAVLQIPLHHDWLAVLFLAIASLYLFNAVALWRGR